MQVLDANQGGVDGALYDIDKLSDGYPFKFFLPVAVGSLGLIEFFLLAALLIYTCAKPSMKPDEVDLSCSVLV